MCCTSLRLVACFTFLASPPVRSSYMGMLSFFKPERAHTSPVAPTAGLPSRRVRSHGGKLCGREVTKLVLSLVTTPLMCLTDEKRYTQERKKGKAGGDMNEDTGKGRVLARATTMEQVFI